MSHPSLFEAVIEKALIGYTWHIEKNGEWLMPFDEYSSTPRALTLRGARHKAAAWIECACQPPQSPDLRVNGAQLLKEVQIEQFAESMIL